MRHSFTGEVLDHFIKGLQEAEHEVEIADLYGEDFQPLMQQDDFGQFEDIQPPEDILLEQERFERCDAFVLIFPIWWWSFPAMLKGWIERVFTAGWAFKLTDDPSGSMLGSRRALAICCAGGSSHMFEKYGAKDNLKNLIEIGILEYCGVSDVGIEILHQARTAFELTDDARKIREQHLATVYQLGKVYFGSSK
jgi:NAD(P)H dehydrogenase (quinone)